MLKCKLFRMHLTFSAKTVCMHINYIPIKLYRVLFQTANLYPANIQHNYDGFSAFLCAVRFASFFNKFVGIFYRHSVSKNGDSKQNIMSCCDLLMWSLFELFVLYFCPCVE